MDHLDTYQTRDGTPIIPPEPLLLRRQSRPNTKDDCEDGQHHHDDTECRDPQPTKRIGRYGHANIRFEKGKE